VIINISQKAKRQQQAAGEVETKTAEIPFALAQLKSTTFESSMRRS